MKYYPKSAAITQQFPLYGWQLWGSFLQSMLKNGKWAEIKRKNSTTCHS